MKKGRDCKVKKIVDTIGRNIKECKIYLVERAKTLAEENCKTYRSIDRNKRWN
jgi:hypothetical protein